MRVIHLKNLKRECVLVELPEGAKKIKQLSSMLLEYDTDNYKALYIQIPFECELIDLFPSITEEQFAEVVKLHATLHLYKDYNTNKQNPTNIFTKQTAKESFISAIESEGRYVNGNPYKRPDATNHESLMTYGVELDMFEQSQEKVIDLDRCYVFKKV